MTGKRKGSDLKQPDLLVRAFLALIAALVPVILIRPVLSEYWAKGLREEGVRTALLITPEDGRLHFLSGLLIHSSPDGPDAAGAAGEYYAALRRNPTDSAAWLALAKALRDEGRNSESDFALRKALFADRNNPGLVWESAVFLLTAGDAEGGIGLFSSYLTMMPHEAPGVYSLCFLMGLEPSYLLDRLVPKTADSLRGYLKYLSSNRLVDATLPVWKRLESLRPEEPDYIGYCDFLILNGAIDKASAVWTALLKRSGLEPRLGIWNGDFEQRPKGGGFDWRIGKTPGMKVVRDNSFQWRGGSSLMARFDGKHNPEAVIASQVVPVSPGAGYTLSGYMKTEGITTTNGIFLEVSGLKGQPFSARSEPVTGNNPWTAVTLEFSAPPDCPAVVVRARRERSLKFDNKISGKVWIDSLTLTTD